MSDRIEYVLQLRGPGRLSNGQWWDDDNRESLGALKVSKRLAEAKASGQKWRIIERRTSVFESVLEMAPR